MNAALAARRRMLVATRNAGKLRELAGKFKGGTDLNFNLKNGGMGIGKINPSVPKAYITLMNGYKKKIINGTLKVPSALK